ncbi:hypothetical protein BGZ65_004008, partial [Modicella reniformis]
MTYHVRMYACLDESYKYHNQEKADSSEDRQNSCSVMITEITEITDSDYIHAGYSIVSHSQEHVTSKVTTSDDSSQKNVPEARVPRPQRHVNSIH